MSQEPGCQCKPPQRCSNPRMKKSCQKCARIIDYEYDLSGDLSDSYVSSDSTFKQFFDRLEESRPERDFTFFRNACARREQAGRDTFGFEYLAETRDNCAEAQEEAADGANYAFFEALRMRRSGRENEVIAELLQAADNFASAHEALSRARLKGWRVP